MAVAPENRTGDVRLASDPPVRPDDGVVYDGGLLDVRLPPDHRIGQDAGAALDDRPLVYEARPLQLDALLDPRAVGDESPSTRLRLAQGWAGGLRGGERRRRVAAVHDVLVHLEV